MIKYIFICSKTVTHLLLLESPCSGEKTYKVIKTMTTFLNQDFVYFIVVNVEYLLSHMRPHAYIRGLDKSKL